MSVALCSNVESSVRCNSGVSRSCRPRVIRFARAHFSGSDVEYSASLFLNAACDLSHPTRECDALLTVKQEQAAIRASRHDVNTFRFNLLQGRFMRGLFATGILFFTTTAVFARDFFALPQPGTMFLLGVAGAGLLLALRKRKK
jgi:hypothetical protein